MLKLNILYNKIKPGRSRRGGRRRGGRRGFCSPHFEIPRKKNQKSLKKINFETSRGLLVCCMDQTTYINALAVSILPFSEPAKPITLGGFFVTLGGFFNDIG
jgi:hypothetical protein